MASQETYVAPSRQGKVNLAVWTTPERRQALKVLAAASGDSVQDIVEEAIDREIKRRKAKK